MPTSPDRYTCLAAVDALVSPVVVCKHWVPSQRQTSMSRLVGSGLAITTVLTSVGLWGPEAVTPDIRPVNDDDSLLAYWPSEDMSSDAPPECQFFNFSVVYTSELCTLFVTTRFSSTPHQAFDRATRCAALHETECVLSPEIGLAVPAAFIVPPTGQIRMILAPKILAPPTPTNLTVQNVRVHQPSSGLLRNTRTLPFNSTLFVEYMDGRSRTVQKDTLYGADAYCVQLLRLSFVDECWKALD